MTLHEIEETLQKLHTRHPGLDEAMLVTLLRAGGWEDKQIEEAKVVFKGGMSNAESEQESVALPTLQEEPILPPTADSEHLLSAHNDGVLKEETTEKLSAEPQSLVVEKVGPSLEKREELPHNLPLRPFETSEHIWPFSRYRDVFYGDSLEETKPVSKPSVATKAPVTPPVVAHVEVAREESVVKEVVPEKIFERIVEKEVVVPEVHIEPVKLSGGDEKLVVMASVMLLVILLLLGYMYSNGRL
jgi:hypothetical protein